MLLGAARRVMLYEITMDVERLMAGEAVEESAYYFRTAPLFETGDAGGV